MKKEEARRRALDLLRRAGIVVTPREAETMEIADLGLGDLERIGLQVIIYENNERYCAKELVLLPRQFFPEHRHPPTDARNRGKQETFRCRFGEVYLYVPGEPTAHPKARVPDPCAAHVTVHHEVVLRPGDQYTLPPDTPHWFQAGGEGAVVSEFSSTSLDETDVFTDPSIRRV